MMMKRRMLRVVTLALALMMLLTSTGLAETLKPGSSGNAVKRLQEALKQLNYYSGAVDGKYGVGTENAVRNFQQANGLVVDGKAGDATQLELRRLTGIEVSGSQSGTATNGKGLFGGDYTKLVFGARSTRVRTLQTALLALGFDIGKTDGVFGTSTYAAVKEFQKITGLTVDGKAGEKTLRKIESYFDENGTIISGPIATTPPPASDENLQYGIPERTLQMGMSGLDVQYTQDRLKELGYLKGESDGQYGTATVNAVKAFQTRNGLTVDGKLGKKTSQVLFSSGALGADEETSNPVTHRKLSLGMEGDDVAAMQARLKALGYYSGNLDGKFGAGTEAALRLFQQRNDLKVDGVCGDDTVKVLYSSSAVDAGSSLQPETEPVVTTPPTRTLRPGDEGQDVKSLQTRLAALGYYAGKVDGKYGAGTEAAVRNFQTGNKLTSDGVCGKKTRERLYSDAAVDAGSVVTPTPEPRVLANGDKGEDVKAVQVRLSELGYYAGAVDGDFGDGTTEAVRRFQARNSLTVDGKVGPRTSLVLYSEDAIPAYSGAGQETPTPTPTKTPAVTPGMTLRMGAEGDDVVLLQSRLIELGYLSGKADGKFGSATGAAVAAFQLRNGLTADGVAGPKTYKKLFAEDAIPAPTTSVTTPPSSIVNGMPGRNLTLGCTGEDVKLVQTRLKDLGYLTGSADGVYGEQTVDAMKRFQAMNRLTADGNGSEAVYKVLFSTSAITSNGLQVNGDAVTETYTNLTIGSSGNAVLRLQQMLSTLKYTVNITGVFDDATYSAVLAFQKRNGLTADGIAGKATQTKLYSGNCVTGDTALPEEDDSVTGSTGNGGGPAVSSVKWLWWYKEIKPTIKSGQVVLVYEPSTNSSFYLRLYSLGRHADSEPLTASDTATMKAAWGGKFTWAEKPVYVRLPNGTWCIASMHCMPHLSGGLKNNDFDGHLCVHFPRTIEECIAAGDDKNGVRHQNDIRKHWTGLGRTVPEAP